ncbi:hypothetical protein Mic7113_2236 [Allocoleopsis franciscana PCC 7113]|uniref:Uncharacterized protein n=1 Tax=Allocoleopsis franciscana PCC 7113 TaxID=1173027 RepID=K9WCD9_9CYAN|nr:hypothetical protein Mic7113_2236 [Allocoleopsis franciscana PCC 7113]
MVGCISLIDFTSILIAYLSLGFQTNTFLFVRSKVLADNLGMIYDLDVLW